jgi:hypothetical protein
MFASKSPLTFHLPQLCASRVPELPQGLVLMVNMDNVAKVNSSAYRPPNRVSFVAVFLLYNLHSEKKRTFTAVQPSPSLATAEQSTSQLSPSQQPSPYLFTHLKISLSPFPLSFSSYRRHCAMQFYSCFC